MRTGIACLELFEPERHRLARAIQALSSQYTAHAYFWPERVSSTALIRSARRSGKSEASRRRNTFVQPVTGRSNPAIFMYLSIGSCQ